MGFYEKITENLAANGIIAYEDKDLYTYGFKQGSLILLNIITTIIIGLIFNVLWQCIVFLLAYVPLRSYAGGYHARTQLRCYLFSIILMIIVSFIIKYVPWNELSIMVLTLVSSGVILKLAPIADANKPFDIKEEQVYKVKSRLILLFEVFLICVFVKLSYIQISICIMISLTALSIMLLISCKNKLFKRVAL